MKDLISVFAYCPDNHRKKILNELLEKLQPLRDKYDLLVVSHSTISDVSTELFDYFYFDTKNDLLFDFDVTNKFWFTTNEFDINSSLVYPFSTHLAIYSLIYYSINFTKFMGYDKIHFIEYDINLNDLELINMVNSKLDEYDNVMFMRESDGWVYGTYFASNTNNLDYEKFLYNREKIIDELKTVENRMTEYLTPKILTQENRTILYESTIKLDNTGIFQKVDQHYNEDIRWCVPVCDKNNEQLYFFIYNEREKKHTIDIIVDNNYFHFETTNEKLWQLYPIGNLNQVSEILVYVDKKFRNSIKINSINNKSKFKENNFIIFSK